MSESSTKPYMIRAIHEWCADQGYTAYVSVAVDERTVVPRAFVKAGEIVLNVSVVATNRLKITNTHIEFQARFGGMPHEIWVPIENVSAIYARETGHGMAFDVVKPLAIAPEPGQTQVEPTGLSVVPSNIESTSASVALVVPAPGPRSVSSTEQNSGTKEATVAPEEQSPTDQPPKPTRPHLTRIK
jgi:stringent starvation protein B